LFRRASPRSTFPEPSPAPRGTIPEQKEEVIIIPGSPPKRPHGSPRASLDPTSPEAPRAIQDPKNIIMLMFCSWEAFLEARRCTSQEPHPERNINIIIFLGLSTKKMPSGKEVGWELGKREKLGRRAQPVTPWGGGVSGLGGALFPGRLPKPRSNSPRLFFPISYLLPYPLPPTPFLSP